MVIIIEKERKVERSGKSEKEKEKIVDVRVRTCECVYVRIVLCSSVQIHFFFSAIPADIFILTFIFYFV